MDYSYLSDAALVTQLRQTESDEHDHRLLSILYRRHHDSVVRKCYYYLKDWEAAQDVSQEVWIRVMAKLHQFRPDVDFTPWLFGIAHNRCQDHLRQNKRLLHQEISRKIIDRWEEELDTEDTDKPLVEVLEELLEKIRGDEKIVLSLRYEQGWSIRAIALSLNTSENNVKKRLSRSRQKLLKLLNKYRR